MEFKRTNKTTSQTTSVAPQPDIVDTSDSSPPQETRLSHIRRLLSHKWTLIGLVIICCLVAGMLIRNSIVDSSGTPEKPSYETILPEDKSISELGGWRRVSPPENDPVYAFTDSLDGIPVSVSQQPLPQSFRDDPAGRVAELAQKFSATEKLETSDITAYVGTSSKGPQSVIFTKNDLLILIKSEKKINNTSWQNYIASLR